MPLFMDRHDVPGATAKDVADAHVSDLELSSRHSVEFLSYWFDADAGGVFCFAKAPSRENLEAVHRESHGLVPNEIISVAEDDVFRFLGRIHDPKDHTELSSPLRTILFTDLEGSTSMLQSVGEARFMELLAEHDTIIRRAIFNWHGREVKHTGDGILAAFDDVSNGLRCAHTIQQGFSDRTPTDGEPTMRVRIGLAAGRPVDRNDDIYGSAVVLASRICDAAQGGQCLVSESVHRLVKDDGHHFRGLGPRPLKGFTEPVHLFELVSEDRATSDGTDGDGAASRSTPSGTVPEQRGRFQRWLAHALGRD